MTQDVSDECRPAAGAENHWFKHNDHGYRLYERISGTALGTFWMYRDFGGKSETLAAEGWTYLRPCRPDDAEARERLEAENARLREALEIARQGLLIVSGQSKCIDNLLSHEAVALEALRLIEEPGNAR